MFRLRPRQWRVGGRFLPEPSLSIALTLALLVAGCGERAGHAPTADGRVIAPPQPHFRSALAAPPVEMEDDGLPVQRAPLFERTRMPVDPSEPFSPNYGAPAARPTPAGGITSVPMQRPSMDMSEQAAARAMNGDHALVKPVVVQRDFVPEDRAASASGISVRDLPDDLPPDFRERLIVMNGLR